MSRASAPKYATAESSPKDVDMCWVAASFSRAAKTYDESATLQHDVGYRLIQRLTRSGMQPRRLLDIGSGTGLTTAALADHLNAHEVVGLDIAPGMVSLARSRARRGSPVRYLCGDAASLPLASNCCDAVFSNMTLQWCHDLKQAARQVKRVLKPQGLFVFSTLDPDEESQSHRRQQSQCRSIPRANGQTSPSGRRRQLRAIQNAFRLATRDLRGDHCGSSSGSPNKPEITSSWPRQSPLDL